MPNSALESLVATMTLAELASRSGRSVAEIVDWALSNRSNAGPKRAEPRGPARPGRKGAGVNTRTPAGRKAYDQAVLAIVQGASGPVGASAIRKEVGGSALQVRTALNRLIEGGDVKYKGRARATRYYVG